MERRTVSAVVLAAGRSSRLKHFLPKVIVELGGRPLIYHLLETLLGLRRYIKEIIVVVGSRGKLVEETISKEFKGINFVYQKKTNGTAKAVEAARSKIKGEYVLVISGDTPLIKKETLAKFLLYHFRENADCSLITSCFPRDNDLGRVVRDRRGKVVKIVERQDLEEDIKEANSGIYLFKKEYLFEGLKKIKKNKKKGEFFLTDIIEIFSRAGLKIASYNIEDWTQIIGVNDIRTLCLAYRVLNNRLIEALVNKGVRIVDPNTTFLSYDTKVGKNVIIYPFTFIEKNVIIGNNCQIGPFVHLRENTVIKSNSCIGNFTEICRSTIGKGVRLKHFSYIGDARIGDGVNIGAGTVTANYDGKNKHHTVIKEKAFIGSDTIIIAPCKIGKKSITGAGAVVTRDVEDNTVVAGVPARRLK